LARPGPS